MSNIDSFVAELQSEQVAEFKAYEKALDTAIDEGRKALKFALIKQFAAEGEMVGTKDYAYQMYQLTGDERYYQLVQCWSA